MVLKARDNSMATSFFGTSVWVVLAGVYLMGCAGKQKDAKAHNPGELAGSAEVLADHVIAASGGTNWGKVEWVEFDFVVVRGGKEVLRANHIWDVKRGMDTVSWGGKSLTIDLSAKPANADEKAAFSRWTNDTYWLLAPLKLKDGGTNLELLTPVPYAGRTLERLRVSFQAVGLTPGDVYTWYIDPQTSLPVAWDYQPTPTKTTRFSWDGYMTVGGLTLATQHFAAGTEIRIENLRINGN